MCLLGWVPDVSSILADSAHGEPRAHFFLFFFLDEIESQPTIALFSFAFRCSDVELMKMAQPRFIFNQSGRFESRFSTLRIESSPASNVLLRDMEGSVLGCWVAHGEGRAHFPNKQVEQNVLEHHLTPIKYVSWKSELATQYPENPNGSEHAIAALCSLDGRHLAIMPHPGKSHVLNAPLY
jgi:phosphoribosylformylglycinamidine (FGAM) synthase-like amidotransferase family enzyme